MRSRRSMKLLIGSLVMAFACVCCSTTDLTIEEVASGQHELQIIKLPSDQQELQGSNESPLVKNYDYPTVSFELTGSTAKTYNDFILKIRNALKGPDAKFNIPMMRNPNTITDSNRFLLVKLSSKEFSTTLAVRVSDAYMVGYCCGKYDEKAKKRTAWFFKEQNKIFKEQNKLLFNDKDVSKQDLGVEGGYDKLGNRKIPLGLTQMASSIADFAKTEKGKDFAKKAALVLIQMVLEATRYGCISNQVAKAIEHAAVQGKNEFTPDSLMLSYQNNWGTLSEAVATSVGEGVFQYQVELKDGNGINAPVLKTVGSVWEIRDVLSLLKFVSRGN